MLCGALRGVTLDSAYACYRCPLLAKVHKARGALLRLGGILVLTLGTTGISVWFS